MAVKDLAQWAVVDSKYRKICNYTAIEKQGSSGNANTPTIPIENGYLAAYNKIKNPTEEHLILLFDGDYVNQNECVAKIKQACHSTQLFTIITPSEVLSDMSLNGYSIQRSHDSSGHLLAIECTFAQVFSVNQQKGKYAPKNPTSSKKKEIGQKQPKSLLNALGETTGFNAKVEQIKRY